LENIHYNQLFNAFIVNSFLFFFVENKKKLILNLIDTRCISQCVENLRLATCDLSLKDILHVYETLICLLIESSSISSILMDDFRLAHCYVHMKDIILR
jgi:hypothetical protein